MRRFIFVLVAIPAILCYLTGTPIAQAVPQPSTKKAVKLFYVYSDKDFSNNSFFIPSGWMGDYSDIIFVPDFTENPYLGSTCIKIIYKNKASQGARWAGIYWQNPSNNWGIEKDAGTDLTGAKSLTFWARGERGGERIEEFKMGGISGAYPDSDTASIGPIVLTTEWKQYSIDLKGRDLSHIIGGFAWSANLDANPGGCTFYLDEIRYE